MKSETHLSVGHWLESMIRQPLILLFYGLLMGTILVLVISSGKIGPTLLIGCAHLFFISQGVQILKDRGRSDSDSGTQMGKALMLLGIFYIPGLLLWLAYRVGEALRIDTFPQMLEGWDGSDPFLDESLMGEGKWG